jgi:hypothetical protein
MNPLANRKHASSSHDSRSLRRFRPSLECLEDRRTPSVTFSQPGDTGAATLSGTTIADRFVIRMAPGDSSTIQISDNGGSSFTNSAADSVTGIFVTGLEGNDTLTLDASNGVIGNAAGLPIRFDGAVGEDILALVGKPDGTVTETFNVGYSPHAALMSVSNGSVSSRIELESVTVLHDTMQADSFTVVGDDANNLVHIHNGPLVAEFQTDTINVRSMELMNGDVDHDLAEPNMIFTDGTNQQVSSLAAGEQENPDGTLFTLSFAAKTNVNVSGGMGRDMVLVTLTQAADSLESLNLTGGEGTSDVLAVRQAPASLAINSSGFEVQTPDHDSFFIERLYASRLGRTTDPSELSAWNSILQTQGSAVVAGGIENSREARTHLVRHWYTRFLGREATSNEEKPWVDLMFLGATEEQILSRILSSQEYSDRTIAMFTTGTNDERYVQSLYFFLLNRTPTASEVSSWTAQLPAIGREAAALGFLQSSEFRTDTVTLFYSALLQRSPDQASLASWVNSGLPLGQVRLGFEQSAEFFARD